jgi:hypothetical protein
MENWCDKWISGKENKKTARKYVSDFLCEIKTPVEQVDL